MKNNKTKKFRLSLSFVLVVSLSLLSVACKQGPEPDQDLQIWYLKIGITPNSYGVHRANADMTNSIQVVSDGLLNDLHSDFESKVNTPDGVIVDLEGGKVYWTNMNYVSGSGDNANGGSVARANLDGTDVEFVIPPGDDIIRPKQITMDFENRKLYWSDREGASVWRCNPDGSELERIVDWSGEDILAHQFVGIAVDPDNNKFYWTDRKANNIHSASMDVMGLGKADTNSYTTIVSGLNAPIDLILNSDGSTIYFTERGKGDELIGGCTTCGSVRSADTGSFSNKKDTTLLVSGIQGVGIDIDEISGRIYYSDIGGEIGSVNLDGTDQRIIADTGAILTTGIDLVRP